jgi:hypothetical protein
VLASTGTPSSHSGESLVLCVDLGGTRCRIAAAHVAGDTPSSLEAVHSLEHHHFITGVDGIAQLAEELARHTEAADRPITGLALCLPAAIFHLAGGLEPPGMSWPRRIGAIEDQLGERLGVPRVTVLNDAVAFGLGCVCFDAGESVSGRTLCLTLGTNFGCALVERSIGHVTPVEANRVLSGLVWPNGHRGSPAQVLRGLPFERTDAREWDSQSQRSFGELVGWVAGELNQRRSCGGIMLGGGRANIVDPGDVETGMAAVGVAPLPIICDGRDETALLGAASAWATRYLQARPLAEIIAEPLARAR